MICFTPLTGGKQDCIGVKIQMGMVLKGIRIRIVIHISKSQFLYQSPYWLINRNISYIDENNMYLLQYEPNIIAKIVLNLRITNHLNLFQCQLYSLVHDNQFLCSTSDQVFCTIHLSQTVETSKSGNINRIF